MDRIIAVVIDDELSNRRLIVDLISELNPAFDIKGEANSVKSGYSLINRIKPEVVFLDIKMNDGSGFELLNMFDEISFEVVFISSFNEYALKAFEFNALDYILKPIEPEKFAHNLNKVQRKLEKRAFRPEDLKALVQSYDPGNLLITKIPVHVGNNVILLELENILYVKAQEGCTLFKTSHGEQYISSRHLSDFDFIFDNHPLIVKANKSIYINLNCIQSYSKGIFCSVSMKDGSVIEISRRKKKEMLQLLAEKREKY